ncbi:MAG: hypothetical protein H6668_14255 [Ardenticatenaceae bacterium]|nr:hypothetical protein [Ardenticatenaceae bacterium]
MNNKEGEIENLLEVRCLGGFRVWVDKRPLTHFYSQKTRALLAYLSVTVGQPQERSRLAGLLWPDYAEERARRNLSQTLTALRKDLGPAATWVQSSTRTIGLANEAGLAVDVVGFEQGLTAVRHHHHPDPLTCPTCTETLQQTAVLYQGAFLDQFAVGDSALFENWLIAQREQLAQQAIDVMTRLGNSYATQQQPEAALETTQRLLGFFPWLESAHCQRMLLLAQQGQRAQALAQYDLLCNALMAELGVGPAPETDALYDRILAGEIEKVEKRGGGKTAVFSAPQPNIPFHAPPLPPHFVGREAELQRIQHLLQTHRQQAIYIAIAGMGGVGKTTFATYVAHQLKPRFADGILWGNNKTSDVFNTLELWARAYGNDFSGISDLDSKAIAVRDMLADKQVLVVIDNVEDAALARPLLPHGEHTVTLITTRNLDVAAALNAMPISLTELEPTASQQLLRQIVGEARLTATPDEIAAAAKIGQLLHHLPLAVEIAAKRLLSRPRMRLAVLAQRLETTQHRLELEISDQAVRTSFQISWETLTVSGKHLFAAMGHFAGRPFLPQTLAAIIDQELLDVEDELFTLAALSLVSEEGETRYRQHPLLADFAAEKLALAKTEQYAQQQRLLAYYLGFVQTVGTDYGQLEPEWEQITAVIHLAYQQQQWQYLLNLTDTLSPAWKASGRYTQARQAYQLALEAAQKLDNVEQEALILLHWGEACLEQNDYETSQTKLTQGLHHYYILESEQGIVQTQTYLARIALEQGQYPKAAELLQQNKAILADSQNQQGMGDVLFYQASIAFADGFRLDNAAPLLDEALHHYGLTNNQVGKIDVLRMQADVAAQRGNHVEAEKLIMTAIALSKSLQDKSQLSTNLLALTTIYLGQEKIKQAQVAAEESLAILRRTGSKRIEGLVLRQLSVIHKQIGDYQIALTFMKQSLDIFLKLELLLSQAFSYYGLSQLYELLHESESAKEAKQTAYQLALRLEHQPLLNRIQQEL